MAARSKTFWNALISAADPEIKRLAQRLAVSVPEGSILRSDTAERAIGIVKSFLESYGERLPGPAAAILEKGTDFGDFFYGALGGKDGGVAAEKWMEKFFADSGKRLEKAKKKQFEFYNLKAEFELRLQLLKFIKEKQQADRPASAPVKTINWRRKWKKFKKKYEPWLKDEIVATDQRIGGWLHSLNAWLDSKGVRR